MTEISLNVLDVAENSIRADAALVVIVVHADTKADTLTIEINDNGRGMTQEQISKVEDPFFTTRKTRKVGLGVPFFKQAAECTGGSFTIASEVGKGTKVKAIFKLSHIDRMPLGDINGTIYTLITFNTNTEFLYIYRLDERSFTLDTREIKEILGDIPLDSPEVSSYIKEYLWENKNEVDHGVII